MQDSGQAVDTVSRRIENEEITVDDIEFGEYCCEDVPMSITGDVYEV